MSSFVRPLCAALLLVAACAQSSPPARSLDVPRPPESRPENGDESQAGYWVAKLPDASWRARAIARLGQMYEDTLSKAGQRTDAPEVRALLDEIVAPLARTYVDEYGHMDSKVRVSLIQLLTSFRDKRSEPALKKAFDAFVEEPATSKDDTDVKWAVRAAGHLALPGLEQGVVQSFLRLRASTALGAITYRDYNEAMTKIKARSWAGPLIWALGAGIDRPVSAKDMGTIDAYRDQLFWQTTAAQVLGELRAQEAVDPLIKVMLDPAKADVQATAVLALVKIGKPASDAATELLKSGYDARIATAALVLGTIGRAESATPMVAALKNADNHVARALIARELTKLPPTDESRAAFREGFEKISIEAVVPPGMNALQMLAESAGQLFDASMVDWLLERAKKTKGSGEDLEALRSAIVITVIKLAKPDQMAKAKAAADKWGARLERDLATQANGLTRTCGANASCYVDAMAQRGNQDPANQFVAIKAGYLAGVLGNEGTRDEIIERLGSMENAAVRFVAALVIDHLSPRGSKEAASKIRKVIEYNAASGDQNKIQGDAPLRQVAYRLESREE